MEPILSSTSSGMSLNPGRYFVSYQLKGWASAELMLRDFLE
jgi:hypothetical protein